MDARAAGDEAQACRAAAGTYLSGTVLGAPRMQHGKMRDGVELTHTQLSVRADRDGAIYAVAVDNVFVEGFDPRQKGVPGALRAIAPGERLSLCGQPYSSGAGLHWVHTNCGARPSAAHPNGWLKRIAADGTPGPNLDANTAYCSLFPPPRRRRGDSADTAR